MTLLVTGGAGFIGSNFVLDWLAQSDEPVVNLDALTYAGNLENLAHAAPATRATCFVRGDICDRPLLDRLLAEHRPRAVRALRAPKATSTAASTARRRSSRTNVEGTFTLLEAARASLADARRRSEARAFRFLHVIDRRGLRQRSSPTTPAFTETAHLRAEQPLLGQQGGERPPGARLAPHLRAAGADHQLLATTTGPTSFPEKLIPLMIVNALAGKPLPVYGDGMNVRDWLYVRRPLQRRSARCSARGRVGETYNIGGWNEKPNHRDRADRLRACSTSCGPTPPGRYARLITHVDRPPRPRPPLRDRRAQDRARARLAPGRDVRHRHPQDRAAGTSTTPTGSPTCRSVPTATGSSGNYGAARA